MEWTIITVIVTLVGLFVSIGTPILKLNNNITKLTTMVTTLNEELKSLTSRNSETHERMFNQLNDHETRITVLEHKDDK